MEDLMKRNRSSNLDNADEHRILAAQPVSSQSDAGPSDSSSNLDPASTIVVRDSQASEFDLPSPEGKCESIMHFSDLINLSVLHCSR